MSACVALVGIAASGPAPAVLVLESGRGQADRAFDLRLQAALEHVRNSQDAAIRDVYSAAMTSPVPITVRPITDDRATWHPDGDRTRGHTEPDDGRKRGSGRSAPTPAIIFIPRDTVDPASAHWRNGLLVHELVHAIDLAYGRYNRDYTVRERRAVFIQNIWRERTGFPLRREYHGRFATLDFQYAKSRGAVAEYVRYLFNGPDFPPAPPARAISATPPR
jgi:hypothetical protein